MPETARQSGDTAQASSANKGGISPGARTASTRTGPSALWRVAASACSRPLELAARMASVEDDGATVAGSKVQSQTGMSW